MPTPTEIIVARLVRPVGTPAAPHLLGVRLDEDVADEPRLLPAVRRHRFDDVASLAPTLRGRRVVVCCRKGRKISRGAAALLRSAGVAAETLEGGRDDGRGAGDRG